MALALRAAIGGSPGDLSVVHLKERSFSFLVCSKQVGIWIYRLKSYACKDFVAHFFLWRNGGPNWQWEFDSWSSEKNNEWVFVQPKRRGDSFRQPGRSFAQAIKHQDVPLKSVFDRLKEPLKLIGGKDKIPELLKVAGGKGKIPVIESVTISKFQKVHDKRNPPSKEALISVLNCGRCLEDGHNSAQCNGPFRCRSCKAPGHAARFLL